MAGAAAACVGRMHTRIYMNIDLLYILTYSVPALAEHAEEVVAPEDLLVNHAGHQPEPAVGVAGELASDPPEGSEGLCGL